MSNKSATSVVYAFDRKQTFAPSTGDPRDRADSKGSAVKKVGRFCCPALPEPLESPSVARWGPTALKLCNLRPLGPQLRGKSERLVIVGTCVNEPSRWLNPIGNRAFIALVDPVSPPSAIPACAGAGGGGAGVLPPGSEMPIPPDSLPT